MLKNALSSVFLFATAAVYCCAQDVIPTVAKPENDGSVLPFSAQIGTDVEQVDLATGALSVNIPFISVPGRKMNYTFGLRYDPTFWTPSSESSPLTYTTERRNYIKSDVLGWETNQPYFYRTDVPVICTNNEQGNSDNWPPRTRSYSGHYLQGYIFVDSNGVRHSTSINRQHSGTCPYGNWYIKNENSPDKYGWWFQVDPPSFNFFQAISPNGVKYETNRTIYSYTNAGGVYLEASGQEKESDSHGNQQYVRVGGTDSTGRTPVTSTEVDNQIIYSVPASGGATARYVVNLTDKVQGKTDFNEDTYKDTAYQIRLVSSIELPNGKSYSFQYDNGSYRRLNISSMTLPSGATIDYTWTTGAAHPCITGEPDRKSYITQRKVTVGDQVRAWDISYACIDLQHKQVSVLNPADSVGQRALTVYYYDSASTLQRVEYWSQSGGSLLKAYDVTYGGVNPPSEPYAPAYPRIASVKTTLYSGASSIVSLKEFEYDMFTYMFNSTNCSNEAECDMGLFSGKEALIAEPLSPNQYSSNSLVTTREYDWGNGQPGALVRQTLRRYAYQGDYRYLFTLGTAADGSVTRTYRNLSDLVTKEEVYDGAAVCSGYGILDENGVYAPSQSTCGANKITETSYTYDGGNPSLNGYLGNLTAVTRGIGSDAVATSYEYDAYGNVIKVRDGAGVALSSVEYLDSWGSGGQGCVSSSATNAYPTRVTNAVGQDNTFAYDSCTGKVLSSKNPDDIASGRTGTTYAYDTMGRKTSSNYPDGGNSILAYDDANNMVSAKRSLNSSAYSEAVTSTNEMGENVASTLSNGANGVLVTYQEYDNRGRKWRIHNPVVAASFSAGSTGTSEYTESSYDALDRVASTTHQDGSSLQFIYDLNKTTIVNENNFSTEQTVDALGRLTKVVEDKAGLGYETQYGYDILGNLKTVNQHGGTGNTPVIRNFTYNSLSQLVESYNPETGSICYGDRSGTACTGRYDSHGNLKTKTDARGTVIQYQYDTANRLVGKTYSDATPTVCYQYDISAINGADTNHPGYLRNEWTQPAHTTCTGASNGNYAPVSGQYLALKSYLAYDAMGRPRSIRQQQCKNTSCSGSLPYILMLTYDLVGNMKSYSIPELNAGTTYSFNYDTAMRLISATSSWQDATHPPTLFSASSFGPFGLLSETRGVPSSGASLISATHTYDVRGRSSSEVDVASSLNTSPATGSLGAIYINLSAQSQPAQSTGTVTVDGSDTEFSIDSDGPSGSDETVSPCGSVCYDSGIITLTVGSYSASSLYAFYSTSATIASDLASALNVSSSPVTATVSGSVIHLTSKATGTGANYALQTSVTSDYASYGITSFTVTPSASAMSSNSTGAAPSGTIKATMNGVTTQPVAWNASSTVSGVATSLASAINSADSSFVTATASGSTISLTSVTTGASTNWNVSVSVAYDTTSYSSSALSASSMGMSGGADAGYGLNVAAYSYSIPTSGFDPVGNIRAVTDSVMGNWTYGYDALNRLTSAHPASGNTGCFTFDAFGNRTAEVWQASCGSVASTATYNEKNRVTWTNVNAQINGSVYDDAGNVTNDNHYRYLYDAEGRICAVQDISISSSPSPYGYLYDASGTRTAKGTLSIFSCDLSTNGFVPTATYMLGLGGEQLAEFDGAGNWIHTNVFAGGKLLATYLASDNDTHFPLTDWLGTKRAELTTQSHLSTFFSLPFGNGLQTGGSGQDATEHHYTGKERDSESGNDYFGARYYASSMGRWLSPDWSGAQVPVPYANLSDPQSLNLYAYVRNNPLGIYDPDGHGWWKDFFNGLANATYRPIVTMVEHPILTGKAIGNSVAHPVATYHALKNSTVTISQQVMAGDGTAIGTVVGTGLMLAIPGAGEAGEAADAASDLSKLGELGEAAGDSGSLLDLNKSLASQEQMGELAAGKGTPIAGAGTGTALRDADRLAAQYGGQPGDWQKVASGNYNPGGAKGGGFETHAYQNSKTGQVVEMKSKMQ